MMAPAISSAHAARPIRALLLLAALLAFAWQSIVTQSHVHPDGIAAITATQPGHQPKLAHAPATTPDACPICRQIAQAGHYLVPPPPGFPAPRAGDYWLVASLAPVLSLSQRPPLWQSRAPPALPA